MSCEHIRDELEASHDGELDPTAAERVTTHLESCAPCRDHVARLRALGAFLDTHGHSPVPTGLRDRIVTAAATTRAPERGVWNWLMPRLAAAGLGALCVGGAWWFGADAAPTADREPIARYLRATNVSTSPGELEQLRARPENQVLAWARQERNK